MDTNIFVTKIFQIIVPDKAILDENNIHHHPDLELVRNEHNQIEQIALKNPSDAEVKS